MRGITNTVDVSGVIAVETGHTLNGTAVNLSGRLNILLSHFTGVRARYVFRFSSGPELQAHLLAEDIISLFPGQTEPHTQADGTAVLRFRREGPATIFSRNSAKNPGAQLLAARTAVLQASRHYRQRSDPRDGR